MLIFDWQCRCVAQRSPRIASKFNYVRYGAMNFNYELPQTTDWYDGGGDPGAWFLVTICTAGRSTLISGEKGKAAHHDPHLMELRSLLQ